MEKFKLTERYKYAGDIYPHLTAMGFTPDEAVSFLNNITDADVVPKSEVVPLITLNRHLKAQNAQYDQALQDKARECNIAIDKIRLEHREEIRALQEKHEAELAVAKREVAWEIFAELDTMDIRVVRLLDAIKYMDLVKKYEYKNN